MSTCRRTQTNTIFDSSRLVSIPPIAIPWSFHIGLNGSFLEFFLPPFFHNIQIILGLAFSLVLQISLLKGDIQILLEPTLMVCIGLATTDEIYAHFINTIKYQNI